MSDDGTGPILQSQLATLGEKPCYPPLFAYRWRLQCIGKEVVSEWTPGLAPSIKETLASDLEPLSLVIDMRSLGGCFELEAARILWKDVERLGYMGETQLGDGRSYLLGMIVQLKRGTDIKLFCNGYVAEVSRK